jgi:hypothetical protein
MTEPDNEHQRAFDQRQCPPRVTTVIPDEIRTEFERHGESVISHALALESVPGRDPLSLHSLIYNHRNEALAWLAEKRKHERRKVWIGWGIGWGLSLIVISIALYNVFITKQTDSPELISAYAKLFINQQALPHELVTTGWVNMGKRTVLRGIATLYTVSKDGSRYHKFGYSEITNGAGSSITTIAPGLGNGAYAQFAVDMKKFLGLFLICTKYRDENGRSYNQKFVYELGEHLEETITRLDEVASSQIPHTTCKR